MLHAKLAEDMGIKNTFVLENGSILELGEETAKVTGTVPSGKIMVDGLGVGDVGNIVLRDRKLLAQDGLIVSVINISNKKIVGEPEIISRGFVYVSESEELMENFKRAAYDGLYKCLKQGNSDWMMMKNSVKSSISKYIFETTRRSPIILPIIIEV